MPPMPKHQRQRPAAGGEPGFAASRETSTPRPPAAGPGLTNQRRPAASGTRTPRHGAALAPLAFCSGRPLRIHRKRLLPLESCRQIRHRASPPQMGWNRHVQDRHNAAMPRNTCQAAHPPKERPRYAPMKRTSEPVKTVGTIRSTANARRLPGSMPTLDKLARHVPDTQHRRNRETVPRNGITKSATPPPSMRRRIHTPRADRGGPTGDGKIAHGVTIPAQGPG